MRKNSGTRVFFNVSEKSENLSPPRPRVRFRKTHAHPLSVQKFHLARVVPPAEKENIPELAMGYRIEGISSVFRDMDMKYGPHVNDKTPYI